MNSPAGPNETAFLHSRTHQTLGFIRNNRDFALTVLRLYYINQPGQIAQIWFRS